MSFINAINYTNPSKACVFRFYGNAGGVGDFIKYSMYVLNECIKNNHSFYVDIRAPIYKFLIIKYDIMDYNKKRPSHSDIYYTSPGNYYNILHSGNMDQLDRLTFFNFFDFIPIVYDELYKMMPKEDYITIHIRLGDKYLENRNIAHNYCDQDVRTKKPDEYYLTHIDTIMKTNNTNPVILLSDNVGFKKLVKQHSPTIIINEFDIVHTSFNYNNNTNVETLFAKTLAEFLLLVKSKEIYALTISGFPVLANKVSEGNTLHTLYKLTPI